MEIEPLPGFKNNIGLSQNTVSRIQQVIEYEKKKKLIESKKKVKEITRLRFERQKNKWLKVGVK